MHQNAFGGRAPPGPAGGAYSAPPDPVAGLGGGGENNGKVEEEGGEDGKVRTPQYLKCVHANTWVVIIKKLKGM